MLEGSWRVGHIRVDSVHSEHVELKVVVDEMVKIGVGRLSRNLLRDADTEKRIEGLLLADSAGRIGHEVSILDEGAHHGAGDTAPALTLCLAASA